MTISAPRQLLVMALGLLAAGLVLLPATVMAQGGPGGGDGPGHFTNPRHLMRIADELELTDEQRDQIGDVLEENRDAIRPLRRQMRQEGKQLREMMADADTDRQDVYDQLDQVLQLEAQVKRKRTSMILDVRDLLDDEQLNQAQQMFEQRREQMQQRRQNRGQHRQQNRRQRRGQ